MSKRGENIRKRKDGRWEARILTDTGKYKSIYAPTYNEVKNKMRTSEITEDKPIKKKKTFENLCTEWLNEKEIKNKESTIARYKGIINKHLIPYFNHTNLSKIDRNNINSFIKYKTYQGNLGAKSIQDITAVLIQILRYAEREKYIQPLIYDFSRPVVPKKELEVLSTKEQEFLVNNIKQDINRENIGILLSLYAGLRLGEVCALQWQDIDLNTGIISITKTMQRISAADNITGSKTKIIIDTPKSLKSVRKIPIPDFLLSELRILSNHSLPKEFILTGQITKYTEPRAYQYRFKKYLKQTGIRDINYHALRHTFATRAVEQNMDIKTLSEILGHSTVSFTLDRYVHPTIAHKKQNMEKLAVCF